MEGFDELLENEEFTEIRNYPNYIISNMGKCYNKKTKQFVGADCKGYVIVSLCNDDGQQNFYIHQLVMDHFGPPKPDGIYEVDHINQQRDDNRIENLRWITKSNNNKNRGSSARGGVVYEYFDEIPADFEDIIDVRDYGTHQIEDLYFADNYFYFDTGVSFRRLHINYDKKGYAFVYSYDTDDKKVKICYTKFKKIYGLD